MGSFRAAVLLVAAAAALLSSATRAAQAAPSFDCRRASTIVEREICRKPQLAEFDRQIAALYAQALDLLNPADAIALRTDQRLWIKVRDDCRFQVPGNPAARSDVEGCLADTMATRVWELQAIIARKKFTK